MNYNTFKPLMRKFASHPDNKRIGNLEILPRKVVSVEELNILKFQKRSVCINNEKTMPAATVLNYCGASLVSMIKNGVITYTVNLADGRDYDAVGNLTNYGNLQRDLPNELESTSFHISNDGKALFICDASEVRTLQVNNGETIYKTNRPPVNKGNYPMDKLETISFSSAIYFAHKLGVSQLIINDFFSKLEVENSNYE